MKRRILLITMMLLSWAPTWVQAAADDDTEEVTYEDLVQELSARQRLVQKGDTSPFDTVRLHAGFGMINSFSTFEIAGSRAQRYQNGMQLSVGVDLFHPDWFSEAAWRNFGVTENGSESHTLKELDLKFGHRRDLSGPWSYRLQMGLAQRELKLDDSANNVHLSQVTPALLGVVGLSARINPVMSVDFDASGRQPVIGRNADKGSIDFTFELRASM